MMIKSAGKIIYDTDNLHNVTYVKNWLCKLIFAESITIGRKSNCKTKKNKVSRL